MIKRQEREWRRSSHFTVPYVRTIAGSLPWTLCQLLSTLPLSQQVVDQRFESVIVQSMTTGVASSTVAWVYLRAPTQRSHTRTGKACNLQRLSPCDPLLVARAHFWEAPQCPRTGKLLLHLLRAYTWAHGRHFTSKPEQLLGLIGDLKKLAHGSKTQQATILNLR